MSVRVTYIVAASLLAFEEGHHPMEFGWLIAFGVWLVD
jgi:hypothetical protein